MRRETKKKKLVNNSNQPQMEQTKIINQINSNKMKTKNEIENQSNYESEKRKFNFSNKSHITLSVEECKLFGDYVHLLEEKNLLNVYGDFGKNLNDNEKMTIEQTRRILFDYYWFGYEMEKSK